MNLKMMNESFKRKYSTTLTEQMDSHRDSELKKALEESIQNIDKTDLRLVEGAFQTTLEKLNPDKSWWEVTDCMINESLFNEGVEATLNRLVEEDDQKKTNNIVYSKNGVEVEYKGGNYFSVIKNGICSPGSGFYVKDDGKNEEEIKQRARDKASMGDFKNDPGADTPDAENESLTLTEDDNTLYILRMCKPFRHGPGAGYQSNRIRRDEVIKTIESYKQKGFITDTITHALNYKQYDPSEFDPDYSKEDNDLACVYYDGAIMYLKVIFKDFIRINGKLEKSILRASYNPLTLQYHLEEIKEKYGEENIVEIKCLQGYNKKLDLNKLISDINSCKYRAEAKKAMEEEIRESSKPTPRGIPVGGQRGRFESWAINKLKEHLSRLNEAEMSDEDKHDSALIKGMIDKIEKRSNARFTPEEQAMMDKYGITRNNWNKELSVDGRSLHPDYDGKQRKVYTSYDDWKGHYVQNGDPSKINYADRARKLPKRADDQISGKWTPNGYINAHTRKGQSTLQDVERNTRNAEMQEPVNDMKRHLQDRKWQQEYIDGAQDEYDKSMASAQAEYDRKMKYATDTYRRHTVDATKSRDAAQARIDKMLKRK